MCPHRIGSRSALAEAIWIHPTMTSQTRSSSRSGYFSLRLKPISRQLRHQTTSLRGVITCLWCRRFLTREQPTVDPDLDPSTTRARPLALTTVVRAQRYRLRPAQLPNWRRSPVRNGLRTTTLGFVLRSPIHDSFAIQRPLMLAPGSSSAVPNPRKASRRRYSRRRFCARHAKFAASGPCDLLCGGTES